MPTSSDGPPDASRIDDALGLWRQGDIAFDEPWFVHVGDPAEPLTAAARETDEPGLQPIGSEVSGLVVVTQTCDLVRSCLTRPYVEVSPLVPLENAHLEEVRRGKRPNLATFEVLQKSGFAVDLDRVMTLEKSIVARWRRSDGCANDEEARRFAGALARKRARTAFPNDFTAFAQTFSRRLPGKHERDSDEGRLLRALREIRVTASPDWNGDAVSLMFWFVRDDARALPEGFDPEPQLSAWLDRMPAAGRFVSVDGMVTTLEDMTAADFVGSDVLDLDHLSLPR